MHDPLTVAFSIEFPWKSKSGYRPEFITIWHKDPCKDGTDSSCNHAFDYRKLNQYEKALNRYLYDAETIFDNRPHYPDSREHLWFQELKKLRYEWRARRGFCRIPWRFHFWHWRFQIHPLQKLFRFLFKRCCKCGKRLGWNEGAMGSWSGDSIWHFRCDDSAKQ